MAFNINIEEVLGFEAFKETANKTPRISVDIDEYEENSADLSAVIEMNNNQKAIRMFIPEFPDIAGNQEQGMDQMDRYDLQIYAFLRFLRLGRMIAYSFVKSDKNIDPLFKKDVDKYQALSFPERKLYWKWYVTQRERVGIQDVKVNKTLQSFL